MTLKLDPVDHEALPKAELTPYQKHLLSRNQYLMAAPATSTAGKCARLPGNGLWSHQAQGKILKSPITGLVFVPFDQTSGGGGWNVVVIECPPELEKSYPVGGYNLFVGADEIERSIILHVPTEGIKLP